MVPSRAEEELPLQIIVGRKEKEEPKRTNTASFPLLPPDFPQCVLLAGSQLAMVPGKHGFQIHSPALQTRVKGCACI